LLNTHTHTHTCIHTYTHTHTHTYTHKNKKNVCDHALKQIPRVITWQYKPVLYIVSYVNKNVYLTTGSIINFAHPL
jgi:hypothetical protein